MSITIKAYANCDHAYVAWQSDKPIKGCLGFALLRKRLDLPKAAPAVVQTWVGFSDDPDATPGTHKPSTEWPIQKFMWSDYMTETGWTVSYQVVPMTGTEKDLKREDGLASPWSEPVALAGTPGPVSSYFNRGIVASQWLSRKLKDVPDTGRHKKLETIINSPGDPIRNFLSGYLRDELLKLLKEANDAGGQVFGVLYELNDPELIAALKAMGKRAHVILTNGTHTSPHGQVDENAKVRGQLKGAVDLSNRMVGGNHLAHNKFLVFADKDGAARKVWTGSTNWTVTGLCTQANNAVLIDDPAFAELFKAQWQQLKDAGDGYDGVAKLNSVKRTVKLKGSGNDATVWFAPVLKGEDLDHARSVINNAKQGVLFLMFNPGPRGTLLNDIMALDPSKLYIHGVVNQDPGGVKNPVVLVQRGVAKPAPPDVVLPAAIDARFKYWMPEMKSYSLVMVHSKTIIVDPFGDHPVVMTGSHNMGPKASSSNDDNLVIIEDAPELAAQYAVNIMTIFNQYNWNFQRLNKTHPNKWDGLKSDDSWQDGYFQDGKKRELAFWLGQMRAGNRASNPPAPAPRRPKPKAAPKSNVAPRPKAKA